MADFNNEDARSISRSRAWHAPQHHAPGFLERHGGWRGWRACQSMDWRTALGPNPTASAQDRPGYYPPTLNGMRGSHPGAFEVAHSLRDGTFWEKAGKPVETGEEYDLVVVGGGISGLAAAYFYRKQAGPSARILILDNHDDFGGHAKRNEFHLGGRMLLTNGGTVSIESPFPYSKEARGLLAELGIDPPALQKKYADNHEVRRSWIWLLLR